MWGRRWLGDRVRAIRRTCEGGFLQRSTAHGGTVGGGPVSGQRVIHLQGTDPSSSHRRSERQFASRSPAAQADAGAGGRLGGPYRGTPGYHTGGLANLAAGRARGSAFERRDVVGRGPPGAIV